MPFDAINLQQALLLFFTSNLSAHTVSSAKNDQNSSEALL